MFGESEDKNKNQKRHFSCFVVKREISEDLDNKIMKIEEQAGYVLTSLKNVMAYVIEKSEIWENIPKDFPFSSCL